MSEPTALRDEIDQWFAGYFKAFIDIGAGKIESRQILRYWCVPLHTSSPALGRWLQSADQVVAVLDEMQRTLKQIGYTHTVALDQSTTVYNEHASRVEAIMSRRRADGLEVDRAAVSFELRRARDGWIIVSTAARPTGASFLRDAW